MDQNNVKLPKGAQVDDGVSKDRLPRATNPGGRRQTGPRSHSQEIKATLCALHEEGWRFSSKKAAYRAVIKRLKIPDNARGWSYSTFARLDLQN